MDQLQATFPYVRVLVRVCVHVRIHMNQNRFEPYQLFPFISDSFIYIRVHHLSLSLPGAIHMAFFNPHVDALMRQ